jgi:DNA-binding response OmpR family regulator
MKILIADDNLVCRRILEATLTQWGYEVVVTSDGEAAWRALQGADVPPLALLDWMMPGMDGPEICRRVRAQAKAEPVYLILLTAREGQADMVAGLDSGADDYIVKPFNRSELQARLRVGLRIIGLQRSLAERVRELEEALGRVTQLHGMLPMCAWCKKIRDDQNYWLKVESYLSTHSDVRFTHGICPECYEKEVVRLKTPSGPAGS